MSQKNPPRPSSPDGVETSRDGEPSEEELHEAGLSGDADDPTEEISVSLPAVAGALVPARGAGDPLTAYLRQLAQYPLLTAEEEVDLAHRYRDHKDLEAAYRLTTSNLRLVVKIAFELNRTRMDILDLIQEGNLGLMRAVQKYDPDKGIRFASYAVWWIKGYIYKYILDNWKMVKIGTTQNQRKLFFSLRKEEERLRRLGFVPTPQLIADGMGVREEEVTEMQKRLSGQDLSLDAPLGEDSDAEGIDLLAGEEMGVDQQMIREEFAGEIRSHMAEFGRTLQGRDRMIFEQRMLAEEPITLQEIGDRLGITRERTRQLESRIKRQLKEYLEARVQGLRDVDFRFGD